MNTLELNNRKYTLIEKIMRLESDIIIKKIEDIVAAESKPQNGPIAYTPEEIKLEVAEAEKETISYSQEEVKTMSWKK